MGGAALVNDLHIAVEVHVLRYATPLLSSSDALQRTQAWGCTRLNTKLR